MTRLFEQYRMKRGDNLADTAYWNRLFEDWDLRFHSAEEALKALAQIGVSIEQIGLDRLNNAITPLVIEAQTRLTSIPRLFEASSASTTTIGTGEKSFIVEEIARGTWVVSDYLSIHAVDDPAALMAGTVVSFNRATGLLVVNIESTMGSGSYTGWRFIVSGRVGPRGERGLPGPPGSMQSAAEVPLAAIAGLTAGQVQAAVAELLALIVNHGHSIAAIAGLQAALDGKAASFHGHAISDISGLQGVLDGKASSGHSHDSIYARLAAPNSFTRQNGFAMVTLTDAATIAWDVASQQVAKVTLGGNRTLGAPTNTLAGFTYLLEVIQDGTGGRTLGYNAIYKWPDGVPPVLPTAAGAKSLLTFLYDGAAMLGSPVLNFA